MTKLVGVRFRYASKIYYFDPGELTVRPGMHVIVETSRGTEYGEVVPGIRALPEEAAGQMIKPIVRIATADDDERVRVNREKEKEALGVCKQKIREHELEMKLIDAEYAFDNSKLLFYFTADGRVDFRDLVKDLAAIFRTRIELRQIGVRDETKYLGGIGICGRPLCCHTWLTDFVPVTIKMAKEQNLSLSPSKISGVCGRLMCCLKNEQETYEYLNSHLPGVGDEVTTPDGRVGEAAGINVLRQRVKVLLEVDGEFEIEEYPADELTFIPRKGGKSGSKKNRHSLRANTKALKEEKKEKNGKAEGDKPEREAKAGRQEREPRAGQDERAGREPRAGQAEKAEREAKGGREERGEREAKAGREERGEREAKAGREERGEREAKGGREERGGREPKAGHEQKSGRDGRPSKDTRPEKSDKNGRSEKGQEQKRRRRHRKSSDNGAPAASQAQADAGDPQA